MTDEAKIEINGYTLTEAQSITVRVAIKNFAMDLSEEGNLSEENIESGMTEEYCKNIKRINEGYRKNIGEIRKYFS